MRKIEAGDRIVHASPRGVEQTYKVLGYSPHTGRLIVLRASGTVRKAWWRRESDLPDGYRLVKASDERETGG